MLDFREVELELEFNYCVPFGGGDWLFSTILITSTAGFFRLLRLLETTMPIMLLRGSYISAGALVALLRVELLVTTFYGMLVMCSVLLPINWSNPSAILLRFLSDYLMICLLLF